MTRDLRDPEIQRELYSKASQEYDEIIRKSDTHWGKYYKNKIFNTVSSVMPKERRFMLDVGGGTGTFSKLFVNSFKYVVNADLSKEMLNQAKKYDDILLVESDAQKLPFKDDSFDLTLCEDTLHHLPNAELVVSEMKRVTKTGGRLVVIEMNKNWANTLRDKLIKLTVNKTRKKKKLSVVLHQDEIYVDTLREMFNNVGLTDYKKYNVIFIPPSIQNKYLFRVLEFLEMMFERIPIIKNVSGKVCFVGFVN